MCELLAMSCRHPARLSKSLTVLASHAQGSSRNRDGWGAAYFQGSEIALYQGASAADSSHEVRQLEKDGPLTNLCMAYIRHATQGPVGLQNTGPFVRELNNRKRVFIHNGNLNNLENSQLYTEGRFKPFGETDSEKAFLLLLEILRRIEDEYGVFPSLNARLDAVANIAATLRRFGPASFLYADGDALFAHADRRIQPLTGKVSAPALFSLECPVDEPTSFVRESKLPDANSAQQIVLIASVPLSNEAWKPIPEGAVIAIQNGRVVASQFI
ncbi:MAG: class II glutamine amidotransferase [Oligoflexales bacterium]|nr:class II glutamine amidotransferase [Oligoflexales bacterium]